MVAGSDRALRNAGLLMVQRVLDAVGVTAFAVIVPRLLGPVLFGRYALLTSVSMWFALLSGLGAVSMLTRSVPRMAAAGDDGALRRLATSMIVLRAITGSCSAAGFFLVATLLLGEPDLLAAAFVAGSVFFRTVGNLGFALLLSLNDAARWGMGDLLRRWTILVLVPLGFAAAGLRGACLGLLGAEAVTLSAGIWWAWPWLRLDAIDLSRKHLAPFLRIGSLFAAGNLLLTFTQRSGETLVRFATNSYEEVGYFGAAYAVYLTVAHALSQLVSALAPHLIGQFERGERRSIAAWLERMLKYMVAAGVLCVAGAALLAPSLVPLVMGRPYTQVASNVAVITIALLTVSVGSVARLQALMLDRPRAFILASAVECAVFWAIGFPLARRFGSFGACLAVVPASTVYAWLLASRVQSGLPFSFRPAGKALAAAVVFLPLILLSPSWPGSAVAFAAGAAAYVGLLLRLRVVTVAEIAEVRRILRAGHPSVSSDV
jgi:O-antigen/teichoic acid export membrane protein